jgi:hypothetical protein
MMIGRAAVIGRLKACAWTSGWEVLIVKDDHPELLVVTLLAVEIKHGIITYFSWLRDPCDPHLPRTF